jgi:hypothetical protein
VLKYSSFLKIEDLPDITPRWFIRHPIAQSFLRTKFTLLVCPTLTDWHVSLSNRSHIKAYIKQARTIRRLPPS